MPKLKTHKGTAKRIKISGSGKLIRERAFGNHILIAGSDLIAPKGNQGNIFAGLEFLERLVGPLSFLECLKKL